MGSKQICRVVALLLLAFTLRVHDLSEAPFGIDGDETFYWQDANSVLNGNLQIFYPTNYGHEPLFIYAEAAALFLFGHNSFAMRFTSVVGSLILLAGSYALARRMFNRRVAVVTLALLATLFWPLFAGRIGLRFAYYPLFCVLSLLSLWQTLHRCSWVWAVAAGVFNGLTLYTYTSSRVFPAIVLLWLGALAFLNRKTLLDNRGRLAAAIGLAALIVAPFVNYARQYPDIVNQRANTTKGPLYDLPRGDAASLIDNTLKVAGMFTVRGDPDDRYNADARPIFDPATGLLFYLGAAVAVWRLRRPAYALLFIWLMVGLSPALLAEGAPVFHRALGSLFPIMVLPALAVDWLSDRLPGQWRRWAAPGVLVGALILGLNTASIYFGSWRTSPRLMSVYESDLHLAARYLRDNPPPGGANVFIIAGAAADSAQIMFNLQAHNPRHCAGRTTSFGPARPAKRGISSARNLCPMNRLGVGSASRPPIASRTTPETRSWKSTVSRFHLHSPRRPNQFKLASISWLT